MPSKRKRTADSWRREPRKNWIDSHWVGITPKLEGYSIWQRKPNNGRPNSRVAYIVHPNRTKIGPFVNVTKAKEHAELLSRVSDLTEEDRQRLKRASEVDAPVIKAGFEICPTGGGCTAWQHTLPDGRYFWITDIGGTGLGLTENEPYLLGFYTADGEDISYSEHRDLAETLRAFETLRRVAL